MASPAGNPNQPPPFDMQKLFRLPSSNPNSAAAPPIPYPPPTPYPSPPSNSYQPPPPGPFSYPPPTTPFHHHPFLHYAQDPLPRPAPGPGPGVGVSYPIPSPHLLNPNPNPNPNPTPHTNHGARLMALLGTPPPSSPLDPASSMPHSSPSHEPPQILHATPSAPPAVLGSYLQPAPARLPSTKMPRGRHLGSGDRAVYDVESRLPGETRPPQLEVTPITKYISDPCLVLGRQIAVNRSYICYGLKLGNIRVLNLNTALRALLRGHTQRVTDMAFFAEDVHLLASASVDGRVYVWKIDEGPDEENRPQITGKIVIAVQLVGHAQSYHPRICWHSHKQEILVVGIENSVLKVDTAKLGRGKDFSVEEPVKCHIGKLIDGVQLIGNHDGEVTDLSISQWMTTRLVSSSKDGTVKIWDDRKANPLVTFIPHDGQPVSSVEFMTSPNRPDHIVLVTAGPLNREVKLWASASGEGWLVPSETESWQCKQVLELSSSAEPRPEEAFFNQVMVLPRASLILLANAKNNSIYAIHVDYGSCPASARMDYVADFTVAMPILSLTGTSDSLPDGDQVVQIYCVQTQAIQQYALDVAQCLPPLNGNVTIGKDSCDFYGSGSIDVLPSSCESNISEPLTNIASAKPTLPINDSESISSVTQPVKSAPSESVYISNADDKQKHPVSINDADTSHTSVVHENLDPYGALSASKSPSNDFERRPFGDSDHSLEYPVSERTDMIISNESDARVGGPKAVNAIPMVSNSHSMFKVGGNTAHLITPAEILSGVLSSSESTIVTRGLNAEEMARDLIIDNDVQSVEAKVKVVSEGRSQNKEVNIQKQIETASAEFKEKSIISHTSGSNDDTTKEHYTLTSETHRLGEAHTIEDIASAEALEQPCSSAEETLDVKDQPGKVREPASTVVSQSLSSVKEQQHKKKQSQASGASSPSSSPFNSTDSSNEPGSSAGAPSTGSAFSQILATQEMLNQFVTMQKEIQQQMTEVLSVTITKEGKRVETALGRNMEKAIKANIDALWARFQEENAKHEKADRERMQQITSVITTAVNKDMPAIMERMLKKEISSLGPNLCRAFTPIIEKNISSAIADSFQRGIGDKAVNQLEKSVNSKLEGAVGRQIQSQFQTSGKQALQDSLKSSLESSVIPAFELSCKAMFDQVDTAFRKGFADYTSAAQNQYESTHGPMALMLRDAINSASTITQNLSTELVDGQRKILALLATGNQNVLDPLVIQQSNGPMVSRCEMVEVPLDPTKELTRLISEHKYDEAFRLALQRSDVSIVSWLCSQVDLRGICSMVPLPLSQDVLLSLLQQLACDISNDTSRKAGWMMCVAVVINPTDPMITSYSRPILEQVYNFLAHPRSIPTTSATEIRALMHVVNSVLLSYK